MLEKTEELILNHSPAFCFLAVSLLILTYQKFGLFVLVIVIIVFLLGVFALHKGRYFLIFTFIFLSCFASIFVHAQKIKNEPITTEILENQRLCGKVLKITDSGILIKANVGKVFIRFGQLDRFLLQVAPYVSKKELFDLNLLRNKLLMFNLLQKNSNVEIIVKRIFKKRRTFRLIESPWVVSGTLINVERYRGNDFLENFLTRVQESVRESILRWLKQPDGNIFLGLMLGEKPYTELAILTAFKRTGTLHILAVSGLHIGIFYFLIKTLVKPLNDAFPLFSVFLNIFLLVLFLISIGIPSSGVRALVMASVLELSRLYFRRLTILDGLFTASLMILIANPVLLFDLSFQLSFSAILGIFVGITIYENLKKEKLASEHESLNSCQTYMLVSKLKDYVQSSVFVILGIQIVQLPLSIIRFRGFPFFGALANLLVIPLVAPVMVSGICLIIFDKLHLRTLAAIFSGFLKLLLSLIVKTCFVFSRNPLSYIYLDLKGFEYAQQFSAILMFLAVLIFLLFVRKTKIAKKQFPLILFVSTFFLLPLLFPNGLILFDVGQGTSVLASTIGISALFDGGPPGVNIFEKILKANAPYPEQIFLSHYHLDHSGGLLSLVKPNKYISPKVLWLPPPNTPSEFDLCKILTSVASRNGISVKIVKSDYRIFINNKNLVVDLYQTESQVNALDSNERALIYLISFLNNRGETALFLYPSDCTAYQLEKFCDYQFKAVIAPHHGSKTGFSRKFYDSFYGLVLISSGKNSYGLPANNFLKYLKQRRINAKITQIEGTIYCEAF